MTGNDKMQTHGRNGDGQMKKILMVIGMAFVLCMGVIPANPVSAQESSQATTVDATMKLSAKTTARVTVYKQASTSTALVCTLQKGQEVFIKGYLTVSGVAWSRITATVGTQTIKGYVKTAKLKRYNMFAENTGKVNASSVIMRSKMSTSASKVATLKKNTKVTVYGKTKNGNKTWYYVSAKVNGKKKYGYIVKDYITLTKTTVKTTTSKAAKAKNTAAVYKSANTKDQKYTTLAKGSEMLVLGTLTVNGVKWTKIKISVSGTETIGYVKTSKVGTWKLKEYTKYGVGKLKKAYNLRKEPNTYASKVKKIKKNIEVSIDGYVKLSDVIWYHCTYLNYSGYIPSSKLVITDEPSDDIFYTQIAAFPESYKDALAALHAAHPNWQFVAVDTALSWSDVVANENVVGRNTIQSNYPKGTSSLAPFSYLSTDEGAYDWSTDEYQVKDGSNWYAASKEVIQYYLDPRNFLTEDAIYQFEALAYDSEQKVSVVDAILKNTFMSGTYSVVDKLTGQTVSGKYNTLFMTAGKTAGASPYFLARSSKLELGTSGSDSVSGTYPGYEGIYNYYNIGASDSSTGSAIANGLAWASGGTSGATTYSRPWTNPEKSIIGGAQYIASSYINKGQNTSYFKKFNVVNLESGLYTHQYYTNVQGAVSEAKIAKSSYEACSMTDEAMIFYIPYYDDMPATACELPAAAGNPNCYLKTITVTDASSGSTLSLNKTFTYKELTYTIAAPSGTASVNVGAAAISQYASVKIDGTSITGSNTKEITLTAGETVTVKIVCTAGNGDKATYKVKIALSN